MMAIELPACETHPGDGTPHRIWSSVDEVAKDFRALKAETRARRSLSREHENETKRVCNNVFINYLLQSAVA